jgi:hypothetical protein
MKYEGIDFNSKWAASKTVEEFIEHEKHHGLSNAQLKEAHAYCVKEQNPKGKVKDQYKVSDPDK